MYDVQAASSSDWSVALMPSLKMTPSITSPIRSEPLIRNHRFCADSKSLKTIASVVSLDPQFLVLLVLSFTVENVDSMGFVVLM